MTSFAAYGQVSSASGANAPSAVIAPSTITAPKRLSDWLLEQAIDPDAYPLGLSWRVPGEVPAQGDLKLDLLRSLSGSDREVKADAAVLGRLRDWVRTLPVTGRVPVAVPDARWLQANSARDPLLQPGHSVVLPKRPRSVTVITARGTRCAVTHTAGAEALDYVQACAPVSSGWANWVRAAQPDWVWVAQPDGRVQRFGVAAWNRETQDEPAPGAWIWAPAWNGGFSEHLSQQLISFLATQGPAADPQLIVGGGSGLVGGALSPRSVPISKSDRPGGGPPTNPASDRPEGGLPTNPAANRPEGATPTNSLLDHEPRTTNHESHAPGGASAAWTPSGLPELGEAGAAESGVADFGRARVLPAPSPSSRSRSLVTTASDWGGVGLLQTPSARMAQAGNLTVDFSRIYPYFQGNIMVQPLDWLEAGFRYTNVSNRLYGPAGYSGNQAYKDKSLDAKLRLWTESAYVPEVALGFRDIAGTGLFSGEYVVANKRTGPLDWSLGLGWGYVGGRGNLRNPLGRLFPSFDTRKNTNTGIAVTGSFAFSSYFHGPTALFGGVQYQTPWEPLTLKLEYDGNDYQHEGLGNVLRQSSPWNVGAVYRVGRAVDVTLGVERGNTAMLGVTLHTQLDGLSMPKLNDPPRVPMTSSRPQQAPDWSQTSRDIAAQTDWHVRRIEQRGRELRVTLDDAQAAYWRERADRAAAVLNRDAPAGVDRFALAYSEGGTDMAEHLIDRDAWVAEKTRPLPPGEQRSALIAQAPEKLPPANMLYQDKRPTFESGLGPHYQQTLGGPNGFLLFQVGVEENVKLRLREDTWIQGTVKLGLLDNYNKFTDTGSSDMPRVRTHLREYITTSKLALPNLQATHVGRFGENQYYSVYAGYLESMFAGAGGEWLYRPFASRVAYGVDANLVQQRNFAQDFGFNKAGDQTGYRVATGHATAYWDTGWNHVQANLSVGRYLAKDIGATVDLSRVFDNGVKFGAFFTKTNVSAAKFGEGSFDKGIYLSVPFDAFLTRSGSGTANVLWKPLTRDGGAKLSRSVQLYDLTATRDDRALRTKAAPLPNDESIPADRRETWTPPPQGPAPYTRVTPKPAAGQWAADAQGYEERLVEALYRQQFRNIRVSYDSSRRLTVSLADVGGAPVLSPKGTSFGALEGRPRPDQSQLEVQSARGPASNDTTPTSKSNRPEGGPPTNPAEFVGGAPVLLEGRPRPDQSQLEVQSARGPASNNPMPISKSDRPEGGPPTPRRKSSWGTTPADLVGGAPSPRSEVSGASPISLAVGRAARTALHLGPLDMREIKIVLARGADPVVTYNFADLARLERYFDGEINADQLADSVAVDYLDPSAREPDPLARLDDLETRAEEPRLADLLRPAKRSVGRVASDFAGAARTAANTNWLRMGLFGSGLVLASSALDHRADTFAQKHAANRYLKAGNSFGNALPWLAIAGAGVAALDGSDPLRSRTAYSALEAGGTALLAVEGLKYVFGRARPVNEAGNHAFKPFSMTTNYDSLPSGHVIITWAVATPFAEEYDAPWLYGVAAITNLARVGSRNHWVSDTVASSVLGYAIGKVFWESSHAPQKGAPRVLIHPSGVNVSWAFN